MNSRGWALPVGALRDATSTLELLGWSALARMLVACTTVPRALGALDRVPRWRRGGDEAAHFPSEAQVRLAGACLARSLARSQYLRQRRTPHALVIGTTRVSEGFRAHAWIAPYETAPEGFAELWRIDR
jgi:hypothetical protein